MLRTKVNFVTKRLKAFAIFEEHWNTQNSFLVVIKFVNFDDNVDKVDGRNLEEQLRSCHIFLVGSAFESVRMKICNKAIENFNAK